MHPFRTALLVAGIGMVALTLPQTVAYMRMGGIRSRFSGTMFAAGSMMIAQYFV